MRLMTVPMIVVLFGPSAAAQDKSATVPATTQRWQVGVKITAVSGPSIDVMAAAPIPTKWPEQQVEVVDQDVSNNVTRIRYRKIGNGAKQLVVDVARLKQGESAHALFTFAITKSFPKLPKDTAQFQRPQKSLIELREYLATSPYIESSHTKIKKLAPTIVQGDTDWQRVESIYDWVRANVRYVNGELKGALAALEDGTGDCEEMTSLFIALCRANRIPARTVWVPGHCYPEFYLEHPERGGQWFPCQAAGARAFGEMPEKNPILQKGDNFKLPELRKRLRYAQVVLTAANRPGFTQPSVAYICQPRK